MAESLQYSSAVMEHFMHPRNVGVIDDPDGIGTVGNPKCGDIMSMTIKVQDNRIDDVKFQTFGCGAAIATSSICTEMAKGKTVDEAESISRQAIAEALGGLPSVKMHCSNLASDALVAAIEDYRKKSNGGGVDGVRVERACPCGDDE